MNHPPPPQLPICLERKFIWLNSGPPLSFHQRNPTSAVFPKMRPWTKGLNTYINLLFLSFSPFLISQLCLYCNKFVSLIAFTVLTFQPRKRFIRNTQQENWQDWSSWAVQCSQVVPSKCSLHQWCWRAPALYGEQPRRAEKDKTSPLRSGSAPVIHLYFFTPSLFCLAYRLLRLMIPFCYPTQFPKYPWRCPFPASPIVCSVSSFSISALFNLLSPPFSLTLFHPFAFSLSTSLPCNLPLSAQKGNYKSIACTVELLPFPLYLNSALIRINSKLHCLSQKGGRVHESTFLTHSGPHRAPVPVHAQTQPSGTWKYW